MKAEQTWDAPLLNGADLERGRTAVPTAVPTSGSPADHFAAVRRQGSSIQSPGKLGDVTSDAQPESTISFNDIVFRVGEKEILHRVSGSCKPRALKAIMGPSGAGKSSLLNILAGRVASGGTVEGQVNMNGVEIDPLLFEATQRMSCRKMRCSRRRPSARRCGCRPNCSLAVRTGRISKDSWTAC